ncbi:MAG: zinc ribbon domain-containing protein [Clostridia bacterium]|nr:zinc ribbon domain-containing protein [Clostridia bacterium]
MLTYCPKYGGRTALLNNTCEHCGCKVKTCSECGNIVEESCETCTYCGLSFAKMAEIKAVEAKEADLAKNKKDVAELAKYIKSCKSPGKIVEFIVGIIDLIPIIVACLFNFNKPTLASAMSTAIKVSFIMTIFTCQIPLLVKGLCDIALYDKLRKKAVEINFDRNMYLMNLPFGQDGKIVFDSAIADKDMQIQLIDAFRTESDSSPKKRKVAGLIVDMCLAPIIFLFLFLGFTPIADNLLYLVAMGSKDFVAYMTALFNFNLFMIIFLLAIAIALVLGLIFAIVIKNQKIDEWVKQYQAEN